MLSITKKLIVFFVTMLISLGAYAGWNDITGADQLNALYSDMTLKGNFKGSDWVAYYRADGTGQITVSGEKRERKWMVKEDNQICVNDLVRETTKCYTYQKHSKKDKYRAIDVSNRQRISFTAEEGVPDF